MALIVIPARMSGRRLPDKPLVPINGKPLVQWTWEAAKETGFPVVVATPNKRIADACKEFGARWCRTSPDHVNGTSRVAECVNITETRETTIINWQVDEPLVDPGKVREMVDAFVFPFKAITLVAPGTRSLDSNQVKAIVSRDVLRHRRHRCLYFTREPCAGSYNHIGVYGFMRMPLLALAELAPTPLAIAESLEQLTWIEHDFDIQACYCESTPPAVNSPEDIAVVEKMLMERAHVH